MELKSNGQSHRMEDEDRISDQIDDILLSMLGRLDLFTAARTCVLAKRWRDLPWMLPELKLDVQDFLPASCTHPIGTQHIDQAMVSLTKAIRSCLSNPRRKHTLARLSIKLYMTGNHWCDVGRLVNDAIDRGVVTELDLAIIDEKGPHGVTDDGMRQQARDVNGLFSVCPSMLHCLTRIYLANVRFAEWDMHHALFDCCKQLQHLTLYHCDNGDCSIWQINAPNSRLKVLEIFSSHLGRLDVLCLPKLQRFHWNTWFHFDAPVRFGSVPSLEEFSLLCAGSIDHQYVSLSEVFLHGTTSISSLILDFQGEKIWIQPEIKQLWNTFNMLRKLSLHSVYVGFDLLWITVVLEAAPSIETLDIEIWDHPCVFDEIRIFAFGEQPLKPSWTIPRFLCSNKWQLKELQLVGFTPVEQQISFLRTMMDLAPNLSTILLKDDEFSCDDCDAMETRPPPVGGIFPGDKDDQERIIEQLRYGVSSCAKIIFDN